MITNNDKLKGVSPEKESESGTCMPAGGPIDRLINAN